MPKAAEKKLRKTGLIEGLKGKKLSTYIYEGLKEKFGWKPKKKKVAKPGK